MSGCGARRIDAKRDCPGCESAKRLLALFASQAVVVPKGWMPEHLAECPAREPVRVGGLEVRTWTEDGAARRYD